MRRCAAARDFSGDDRASRISSVAGKSSRMRHACRIASAANSGKSRSAAWKHSAADLPHPLRTDAHPETRATGLSRQKAKPSVISFHKAQIFAISNADFSTFHIGKSASIALPFR
jgi:hypothetical protein